MTRRLEKITRTVRDTVSEVIQNQLSDPRIQGLISVTRVDVAADLSTSRVFLSVLGVEQKQQELSIEAIQHASGFIQSRLARVLHTRTCPVLRFILDDSLKKGFEVLQLIDKVSAERPAPTEPEDPDDHDEPIGETA
jgi:ribosome-binding factor A